MCGSVSPQLHSPQVAVVRWCAAYTYLYSLLQYQSVILYYVILSSIYIYIYRYRYLMPLSPHPTIGHSQRRYLARHFIPVQLYTGQGGRTGQEGRRSGSRRGGGLGGVGPAHTTSLLSTQVTYSVCQVSHTCTACSPLLAWTYLHS